MYFGRKYKHKKSFIGWRTPEFLPNYQLYIQTRKCSNVLELKFFQVSSQISNKCHFHAPFF